MRGLITTWSSQALQNRPLRSRRASLQSCEETGCEVLRPRLVTRRQSRMSIPQIMRTDRNILRIYVSRLNRARRSSHHFENDGRDETVQTTPGQQEMVRTRYIFRPVCCPVSTFPSRSNGITHEQSERHVVGPGLHPSSNRTGVNKGDQGMYRSKQEQPVMRERIAPSVDRVGPQNTSESMSCRTSQGQSQQGPPL